MKDHQQQRYRVVERLASGGMAEVFLAESAGIEGFKKLVAIKRVLPHLSEKKRFIAMFLDEARLSAHLSHSNCVQVFDIGVGDNAYFIVMEYVDGADLKGVIEYLKKNNRQFPVEAAVHIAVKISEGLTYAHELTTSEGALAIVHRDMSPPNVLITKFGEVKIVDFGLAKASSQLEKSEAGIIKGKFSYLAPEAAMGEEVDHRADIFAVGIILWEMLAGRRLFIGDSDFATVKQVQQAKVPSIAAIRKDVPIELERIINRALAKDLTVRYSSARALGQDLISFLYRFGRPVSSFDIAELVRGAMALRKKVAPDKASIIDKLIEEALFEFTSLQDGKEPQSATRLDEPLKIGGFEDIGKWADEISLQTGEDLAGDIVRNSLPDAAFVAGNLAALEDEPVPSSKDPTSSPLVGLTRHTPEPPPPASKPAPKRSLSVPPKPPVQAFTPKRDSVAPPSSAQSRQTSPGEPASGGGGAIKAVAVLLVLAAVAAGAWFAGLIPH
jgi:serine/threonine protein kinase